MFNNKELAVLYNQQTAAEQETEQICKEGEAIRQDVSERSASSHLLKAQAETLSEDKEKLLSENTDLEKEQKRLQQEINKMDIPRKLWSGISKRNSGKSAVICMKSRTI